MTESTPPEGQQPLTQAQIRQLHRSLTEQVLDRAASDPEWKQLYIDDPELAMREANFPEAQQLEQGPQRTPPEREVVGQYYGYGGRRGSYGRTKWDICIYRPHDPLRYTVISKARCVQQTMLWG